MPAIRRRLYIALAILAVGWGIGIAIYLMATDADSLPFEMTTDDRRYVNQRRAIPSSSIA